MLPPPTSVGGNPSERDTGTLIPCPICSLGFSFSSGLKRHLAGHKRNSTAHLAHLVGASGFKCSSCGAEFGTQIGLSQHRRRAHPAEYNDEKLARLPASKYNWSTLEDATLRNMTTEFYASSDTKKVLYTKLASLFPNRSAEAIKKRLQHLSWNPSTESSSSARHHGTDTCPGSTKTTWALPNFIQNPPHPQTFDQIIDCDNDSVQQLVTSQPILHSHLSCNVPAVPIKPYPQHTTTTSLEQIPTNQSYTTITSVAPTDTQQNIPPSVDFVPDLTPLFPQNLPVGTPS
ncbi:uncharacterized protein DEA37_0001539 [Paragonimus westermani]|uniref:C2H2-type domain-containing protein n=1 Tax=Paragonimus westermani TaxID=34504 RepID=A0A5J4NHY5_9TREM|nr:uncharacterized protein DEA37_0001539 [Paragonimus westermani]